LVKPDVRLAARAVPARATVAVIPKIAFFMIEYLFISAG
jgi:hypothetical protein